MPLSHRVDPSSILDEFTQFTDFFNIAQNVSEIVPGTTRLPAGLAIKTLAIGDARSLRIFMLMDILHGR